jgi:hypothetical protein
VGLPAELSALATFTVGQLYYLDDKYDDALRAFNVAATSFEQKTYEPIDDLDKINKAMESLTRASHKLSEMMYQQAGSQAGGTQAQPGETQQQSQKSGSAEDEVIDAEVVDDNKRH